MTFSFFLGKKAREESADPASRTTTTSQSQDTTQSATQSRQLRPQTEDEVRRQGLAEQELQSLLAGMSPEDQAALKAENYRAIYDPAAAGIEQGYTSLGARQDASAARRGLGGSSKSRDDELLNRSALGRDLGAASSAATVASTQMALAERQQRLARIAELRTNINDLWNQRMVGSSVVTTGESSSTGTGESIAPDTFWNDALNLGVNALGSVV